MTTTDKLKRMMIELSEMQKTEIEEIISEMERQIKAMPKSCCENTRKLIAYVRKLERNDKRCCRKYHSVVGEPDD